MKFLIGILICAFLTLSVDAFAQNATCNGNDTQINMDVNGDVDCQGNGFTYTKDSTSTSAAKAAAQAEQDAISNAPINIFDVNIFLEQIAQTSLLTDLSIAQYYAVLKDLLTFKNFQGAANYIGALLQAGAMKQNEVDIIDNALENQQINLDSYNSQVNVSY